MEYPGSKFKRVYRLAVLILFIAAFFLITPTLILYSSGYRYDFKNGLLREVGSLSIDVLPDNADVFLNGIKLKDKLPIRLNNITPRKYTLLISANGYYDWEKQIEVNKNQTTYIKEIILLRKEKPELITKDKVEKISISNSGRFLAYEIQTGSFKKLLLRDLTNDAIAQVAELPNTECDYEWSPESDYLLVTSKDYPYSKILVINAANPGFETAFPVKPGEIHKINWRRSTEPEIYFSTKDNIVSFLPRINQTRVITKNTFNDWYMDGTTLWTMEPNTTTKALDLFDDTLGFNSRFTSIPFKDLGITDISKWRIVQVYRNNILLQNSAGSKFMIVRRDKNFLINGDKFHFSKYNNWLIIWTPWELWTYSDGEDPYLLNRSGDKLIDILPMDQHNTLAIEWNDGLSALYPYYFTDRVLQDKPIKSMSIYPENRTIFYSNSSGLWKLKY